MKGAAVLVKRDRHAAIRRLGGSQVIASQGDLVTELSALGWGGAEAIIADGSADHALERALDDPSFGTRITAAREASVGAA